MTTAGIAHRRGSKLLYDEDPIPVETVEHRKRIEREDRAFVAQLRAAILAGTETAKGVLGHQHGPRGTYATP
jgi:hypothetical protein